MLVKDDESFEGDIIQPLLNGYDTGSGGLELSAARSPGRAPLHVQSGQGVPTDVQHFRPVVERDRISSARIDHDRQARRPDRQSP